MQTDPHNALNGTAHDRYEELALRSLTEPLSFADRSVLDAHLVTCEQCRAALDEWRAIRTAVKTSARKEAFSLPPLPLDRFNRKESRLMILRPLPLAAAVAATILTAFVIAASQRQIAPPGAVVTDTPMPQLAATVMPSDLRTAMPPTATPTLDPSVVFALEDAISYVVREGDTLLSILLSPPFNYAADQINSDLFNRIFELNPNIQGINDLPQPGIMIFIPVPPGAPYVEWQDHTVQPGDTLASILLSPPYNFSLAQITPELMDAILRLNPDMDASGELPDVGETIRIPVPPGLTTTSGDPMFMTATAVVQQAFGANGIDPLALTATQIIQEATATALGAAVTATPFPLNPAQSPRPVVIPRSRIVSMQEVSVGDLIDVVSVLTTIFEPDLPTGSPEAAALIANPQMIPIAHRIEVIAVDAENITLMLTPLAADGLELLSDAGIPFIVAFETESPIITPTPAAVTLPAGWVDATIPLDRLTTWGAALQVDQVVDISVSRFNAGGIGTDEYLLVPITREARVIALDETAVTVALPAAAAEMLTQALRDGDSIYVELINATATPAPRST